MAQSTISRRCCPIASGRPALTTPQTSVLWGAYSLIVFGYLAQQLAQSRLREAWRRARKWRLPPLARLAGWR